MAPHQSPTHLQLVVLLLVPLLLLSMCFRLKRLLDFHTSMCVTPDRDSLSRP
jgi:hypothetical protein